jgi:hypothetical protein
VVINNPMSDKTDTKDKLSDVVSIQASINNTLISKLEVLTKRMDDVQTQLESQLKINKQMVDHIDWLNTRVVKLGNGCEAQNINDVKGNDVSGVNKANNRTTGSRPYALE